MVAQGNPAVFTDRSFADVATVVGNLPWVIFAELYFHRTDPFTDLTQAGDSLFPLAENIFDTSRKIFTGNLTFNRRRC